MTEKSISLCKCRRISGVNFSIYKKIDIDNIFKLDKYSHYEQ